ncbi:MAG TPA: LLM class flavin-dependent oxidoreductase [Stellaceae bacterium]|jgi:alkanesulfonate monooxygenase SsuD/methylene tetrahydromethanopterin reductase-like flavin-dependent oxidoreductase (luciferase family)|nr:LLM class flavin-dependent oxidoreductase [Stellaceae bacterium]
MQFGVQFFPDVTPAQKSATTYFREALDLAEEADRLGYTHIRIVEHYFHYYGGYSPNPIVFLAAAAQRTRQARLVTGAVLPAFNHPLKLAGEIAMLDAISGGRLDVGFARAFLPHEFRRFDRSPDESVARFREGVEQVDLLLTGENVSHRGRFHTIDSTTSLPRPTQQPRPKFYVAALNTPDSFEFAGRMGYSVMAIPLVAARMRPLLAAYREAWKAAGHAGSGEIMLAFHLYCEPDGARARAFACPLLDAYLHSLVDAASDWLDGRISSDYPGYDKVIAALRASNAQAQIESGAAWIGSPDEIAATIMRLQDELGGFEQASLQVNFNTLPFEPALASMRLFAREIMSRFATA